MAKAEEKKPTTEVAVQQGGAVAAADFMDAGDFEGKQGFEGADKESYAIPFITILQKMSPMVDDNDPKHVEGAKAGMLYNTVTQKLTDGKTGLVVIPCYYRRSFIRWGARDEGGGFKGEMTPEEYDKMVTSGQVEVVEGRPLVKDEKGEVNPKKSDYLADTRSHYVLVIDPDTGEFGTAIMSLAASQVKASKMLLTALSQKKVMVGGVPKTPPTFANLVRLTTVGLSNDKGSWSGAKFELEGMVTDANVYAVAKEFYKAVVENKVVVDRTKDASGGDAEVSGEAKTAEEF